MRIATLLFWTIATYSAAQAPIPQQIQPIADQEKECTAQSRPESIVADMRSNPHVESGKRAARIPMISYFTCRALAETNPLACSHLKMTPSKKEEPWDKHCMSEYFSVSSILEVLAKKGDGVRDCRESLDLIGNADLDSEALCRILPAGYFKADVRAICANIPAGTIGGREECGLILTYYDAQPKRCEQRKNRPYDIEICKTHAALLQLLRTKAAASCYDVAMCAAALSRRPELCEPYAKAAGRAFCVAYVKGVKKEGTGGKYTSKQSSAIKAAESKRWVEELKKQERARAAKEEEDSQTEP